MNPILQAYYDQLTWTAVQSSNVAAVAYQPDFAYLWVRFRNGSVYLYEQVSPDVHRRFLDAPSKGRFVYYTLRGGAGNAVYPYRRVV
jgi:lysyl-tRNA synthetase class 2